MVLNSSSLNDIWGWTDPQTGKEYALVGMSNGTSFVDISNPENPIFIGILTNSDEQFYMERFKSISKSCFYCF